MEDEFFQQYLDYTVHIKSNMHAFIIATFTYVVYCVGQMYVQLSNHHTKLKHIHQSTCSVTRYTCSAI